MKGSIEEGGNTSRQHDNSTNHNTIKLQDPAATIGTQLNTLPGENETIINEDASISQSQAQLKAGQETIQ